MKLLVTVIGRGHSGTRAISHTLSASGVFMGEELNISGDLLPPEAMYAACRILARNVTWRGGLDWDFSRLHSMPIPAGIEPTSKPTSQSGDWKPRSMICAMG